MSKEKPILQQLYEWSMRHQDEYKSDQLYQNIDMDKINWLNNAWTQMFKTNSELMKNILKMLNDPETSLEQSIQLLEELSEHMENIDNAQLMRPLNGWELLSKKYETSNEKIQAMILRIISEAIKNEDGTQGDVLQYFSQIFKQEMAKIVNKDKAKYLFRIMAAYFCNIKKAQEIQKIININFLVAFKYAMCQSDDIYQTCQSYYTHILSYLQEIKEDVEGYNKLIKAIVNEEPANVLEKITYMVQPEQPQEEQMRIKLKK